MRNLYKELANPADKIKWEDVGGSFSCQDSMCRLINKTAKYSEELAVLTWQCEAGHISKVKDFHIE